MTTKIEEIKQSPSMEGFSKETIIVILLIIAILVSVLAFIGNFFIRVV